MLKCNQGVITLQIQRKSSHITNPSKSITRLAWKILAPLTHLHLSMNFEGLKMASTKAPLRTAIIGLSSSAITSWASAAHLPGLLTPLGRSKLPITALLNSSVNAARSAIQTYSLSPDTKAYGSPEDLANDPDIDLVICNTRVDKHFQTILPSIKKGKDVFVEWPIASNLADINTLIEEARKSGSRIGVGLQRRWTPPVVKLREIIKDGVNGKSLGKILSVDVRAYGGTNDRDIVPEGLSYFLQREVGGNVIVIGNTHCKYPVPLSLRCV